MSERFLLDTNVLSEIRKPRPNPGVRKWFRSTEGDRLFVSVIVLGEIRSGIQRLLGRDPRQATIFEGWLGSLLIQFPDRILPVSIEVADRWGRLSYPDPIPILDGLLAATALVHGLTVVTRNIRDFQPTSVNVLNPFTE